MAVKGLIGKIGASTNDSAPGDFKGSAIEGRKTAMKGASHDQKG